MYVSHNGILQKTMTKCCCKSTQYCHVSSVRMAIFLMKFTGVYILVLQTNVALVLDYNLDPLPLIPHPC